METYIQDTYKMVKKLVKEYIMKLQITNKLNPFMKMT